MFVCYLPHSQSNTASLRQNPRLIDVETSTRRHLSRNLLPSSVTEMTNGIDEAILLDGSWWNYGSKPLWLLLDPLIKRKHTSASQEPSETPKYMNKQGRSLLPSGRKCGPEMRRPSGVVVSAGSPALAPDSHLAVLVPLAVRKGKEPWLK